METNKNDELVRLGRGLVMQPFGDAAIGGAAGLVLGFGLAIGIIDSNWKHHVKRGRFLHIFKHEPTRHERQLSLWRSVSANQFMLSEDDQIFLGALKARLDAGKELHPKHESTLRDLDQSIWERIPLP